MEGYDERHNVMLKTIGVNAIGIGDMLPLQELDNWKILNLQPCLFDIFHLYYKIPAHCVVKLRSTSFIHYEIPCAGHCFIHLQYCNYQDKFLF